MGHPVFKESQVVFAVSSSIQWSRRRRMGGGVKSVSENECTVRPIKLWNIMTTFRLKLWGATWNQKLCTVHCTVYTHYTKLFTLNLIFRLLIKLHCFKPFSNIHKDCLNVHSFMSLTVYKVGICVILES